MKKSARNRFDLSERRRALLEMLLEEQGLESLAPERIPRRSESGPAPLSYAQQRLWFLDRLIPGNPFYNVDAVVPIRSMVSVPALEKTINAIVARHDTLRTTFREVDGRPLQEIAPSLTIAVPVMDLGHLAEAEREAQAHRLVIEEGQTPFDLVRGPLLRAKLVTLDFDYHVLLLTMHHIISDGWSMGILARELQQLYLAFASGRSPSLPDLPIQYADFAVWQRDWLAGPVLSEQLDYWKGKLAHLPVLPLLTDKPRPPIPTFQGEYVPVTIPSSLARSLKAFCRQEGVTLFMATLAAFKILLYRYTRQEDIVVGSPIANRTKAEIENLIGFFVNTLVLRTNLSGEPSFREVLARVKETALGAYAHQDLPFEKLVEELQPERDLSRNPLFQVIFQLFNAPTVPAESTGSVDQSFMEIQRGTSKFDLRFDLWETPTELKGQLEYSMDLFNHDTITRMAGHYQTLLQNLVAHPDRPISQLPLLTPTEERRIVMSFNDSRQDYPADQPVHRLFEQQAARTPHAIAIEQGDLSLTYEQLDRRAARLAQQLTSLGVRAETLVGVFMERSASMVLAWLAILKAGGAYVPLDPSYPMARIRYMMEDAGVAVVLTQPSMVEKLPPTQAQFLVVDDEWEQEPLEPTEFQSAEILPDGLAYVMYTSGSTGHPKGTCIVHRSINRLVLNTNYITLRPEDVMAQISNASFDAATFEVWGALLNGARLVIIPKDIALSPVEFAAALRKRSITTLFITTALFNKLVAEVPDIFAPLTTVLFGGSAVDPQWVRLVIESGRPRTLLHVYGPTENTTFTTSCEVTEVPAEATTIPIGRPIANTQTYVLDQHLKPVPPGVPGELYTGGDGLARGYLGRPELTAEKFVPSPLDHDPGARLYRTGDLVRYLEDGSIEFLGRFDHQIKIRGFRVELPEIEVVLGQHAAIKEKVVVLREDQAGDKRIVAYVVIHPPFLDADRTMDRPEDSDKLIAQWQNVFDRVIYGNLEKDLEQGGDPSFNLAGWISSYDGLPIPAEAMKEQVMRTVQRILASRPRRVLEIGSGTGLLLFQLAPHVDHYVGTDFSKVALDFVSQQLGQLGEAAAKVTLLERQANDFSNFESGSFDTIILNSVVQYFPDQEYLLEVLEGALGVLKPGGVIFIGDVRSYPLLEAFQASVELYRAPAELPREELRSRIQRRVNQDQELLIDPAYFAALRERYPSISTVQVQQKRGRYLHELTRFRYDVFLALGTDPHQKDADLWLPWDPQTMTAKGIKTLLAEAGLTRLGIKGIPNQRLQQEMAALRLLQDDILPTAGAIKAAVRAEAQTGVHPEDLWALAESLPFEVLIRWSDDGVEGGFDVLFVRQGDGAAESRVQEFPPADRTVGALADYTNNPLQARFLRNLVPELQQHIQDRLPEYMTPSTFVLMDELPLNPNGKVDRAALPAPDKARPQIKKNFVAPRSEIETTIVQIWAKVLSLESLGVMDNFFTELGGHSLLATQVVSRIRKAFDIELPLRHMFEVPTVAGIAEVVSRLVAERAGDKPQPLEAIVAAADEDEIDIEGLSDEEVDAMLSALLSSEDLDQ